MSISVSTPDGEKVLYEPQEKQELLHKTKARQILYGGAAGGGKSKSIRWDAIGFCLANPGCQAYLFRRTLPELEKNHINWLKKELGPYPLGTYSEQRKCYEFANGSQLYMCYCEKESDVDRYQGAEMHWLGVDEAAHLTESQMGYLKTRSRLGDWYLPRVVFSSNPGGVGHSYLKQVFVDAAPPMTFFYDDTMKNPDNPNDKGWLSIYIPARMADNMYLDEDYGGAFGAISPELAKALREGDWDAVVGQALHTLTRERHQIRQFTPPRHWTRFMSIDWGTAKPFSVGWYCVSEGVLLAAKDGWPERYLPEGAIIRYREWYGWNERPDRGCRMDSPAVARRIIQMEEGEVMDFRIGDSHMWAKSDGPSVAERMFEATEGRLVMKKSEKDRKHNYAEFLARLAGNPTIMDDGREEEHPMFFATANCIHFWRTVPVLTLDEIDPDKGPDTKQEDHVYDEVAYALRSRPYVMTEKDRWHIEYADEIRRAQGKPQDPYAT